MKRYYEAPLMERIDFRSENVLDVSSPVIDYDEKESGSKVEIGTLPIDLF